jgi:menaquinone reductase, integral membrane subunit
MDNHLIIRGMQRCPLPRFLLWLLPWTLILLVGVYAAVLCLGYGLNQTNLDNRFAFGLWIFLDLTVIALGAGAFFTGFLLYIMKRHELKAVINSAVVLGFLCYSGAVVILAIDVGQPVRAWYTFWYPNTHSMLTEVTFCITCYLTVLMIEYAPLVLKNRQLRKVPSYLVFEFELHRVMPVFAAVGAFLSFFHQGSLGGLYGVLRGRPFAFREGFFIWPSTFFLFILSAIAVGPAFILLTTWLVSKITGKQLVKPEVMKTLARISGVLLLVYVAVKAVDTLVWLNRTAPALGSIPAEFYSYAQFGTWVLFAEILAFGLLPAYLLLRKQKKPHTLVAGAMLACIGITLNRFILTIQTLALPTLPFQEFLMYWPNWQEIASFGMVIAYTVIVYSISFRYLPLFPQERELARR